MGSKSDKFQSDEFQSNEFQSNESQSNEFQSNEFQSNEFQSDKSQTEKEFTDGIELRNDVIVDWKNIYDKLVSSDGDWTKLIPLYVYNDGSSRIDLKDKITEDELLVALEGINVTNSNYFLSQGFLSNAYHLMNQSAELCMAEAIYYLIEFCKIDPNVGNPLEAASKNGCSSILRYLLTFNSIEAESVDYSLYLAVSNNQLECVKILLNDSRLPIEGLITSQLRLACAEGYVEIVKILLNDFRVDPSYNNNEAIRDAVENNNAECVRLIMQDPRTNKPKNWLAESLNAACAKGYVEVVEALLEDPEINTSRNNNKALKLAQNLKDIDKRNAIVSMLMDHPNTRYGTKQRKWSKWSAAM